MKTYTIEQFKNYLKRQDSFGDVFYNLSDTNIDKANREQALIDKYSSIVSVSNSDEFTSKEKFDKIFDLAKQIPHVDSSKLNEEDIDTYLEELKDHLKYDLGLTV